MIAVDRWAPSRPGMKIRSKPAAEVPSTRCAGPERIARHPATLAKNVFKSIFVAASRLRVSDPA
jgi:hypothetical protein